jgi:hypothetical protein
VPSKNWRGPPGVAQLPNKVGHTIVVDKADPALCFGCASSIKRKDGARRIEIANLLN